MDEVKERVILDKDKQFDSPKLHYWKRSSVIWDQYSRQRPNWRRLVRLQTWLWGNGNHRDFIHKEVSWSHFVFLKIHFAKNVDCKAMHIIAHLCLNTVYTFVLMLFSHIIWSHLNPTTCSKPPGLSHPHSKEWSCSSTSNPSLAFPFYLSTPACTGVLDIPVTQEALSFLWAFHFRFLLLGMVSQITP